MVRAFALLFPRSSPPSSVRIGRRFGSNTLNRARTSTTWGLPAAAASPTDTPAIIRGRAVYGIDVRVPNMRHAVLARPPLPQATLVRFDEDAARKVDGVTAGVRTPSGIAVVARNTWAAIRGRSALSVEWSDVSDPSKNSQRYLESLESALDDG